MVKKLEKYWWLNEESQAILNRGYLLKGENVEDAVKRITTTMANNLNMPELQPKFQEIVEFGYVSLSSPVWSNMGTKRGLPISCSNVHIPDNVEGIAHKLSEVIIQTKYGAGTSGYFGELRGRGASITDNGKSSGSVSFMELFNTTINVVSQGCFKGKAEILTKDGFVRFEDLVESRDKEVVTFDIDIKGNIFYFNTKPLDYIKYHYTDDLYRISYKDFEISCTKDHNILLFSEYNDTFIVTAQDLNESYEDWKHLYIRVLEDIKTKKTKLIPVKNLVIDVTKVKKYVYCVETETNNIIVRENNTVKPILISNSTRRGSFAAYLDIDHPDIKEFLQIKDIGHPIQNLFYGVCVPDYWLEEMINGDKDKREIWSKVLESRQQKGLPYIFFTDNINRNKPEIYKKLGLKINSSNLCSEIALPSTENESFICCLASLNLELYDEWKDTDTIELITFMLDSIMEEYINKTKDMKFMESSHNFAKRHRAIGIGVLGLHSYYQKIGRPFGHPLNIGLNKQIFSKIKEESYKASQKLAELITPAPIFLEAIEKGIILEEPLRRNTTTMAIAPTTSSSAILGQVSPGIEPYSSNYYKAGLAKGNFIRKNKYLEQLLEKYNKNNDEVWSTIMIKQGSVQDLDFLTQEEKEIFKTFKEISQYDIINQASIRQEYIDQTQSLNINIPPDITPKEINKLILDAWKSGVKTFYYQRSQSVSKELLTNIISCSGCES